MKPLRFLRRSAAFLLLLSLLLASLSALSAGAAETEEAIEETEFSLKLSLGEPLPRYSLADGTVELINGTAVSWIDRVILPDEMLALYDTLVEGADNDGYQDVLIEDSYLTNDHMIEIKTTSVTLTGNTASEQQAEIGAAANELLNTHAEYIYAVLAAFDRDHPEVFWLDGNYIISCVPSHVSGKTYSLTLTLKLTDGTDTIRHDTYTSQTQIKTAISQRDAAVQAILGGLSPTDSTYEKLAYFNDTLTKTNEYNTLVAANPNYLYSISSDCRECLAALDGRIGRDGPICESYARAFKVLCDKEDIPCVLVDGEATNSSGQSEGHMWNYAQVDGFWYAVDVTWNDPPGYFSSAVSGKETRDWFLVGADTRISGRAFLTSHPVQNQVYEGGLKFTNGPSLSADAYTQSVSVIPILSSDLIYDGTAHTPEILVKTGSNVIDASLYTVSFSDNVKPGTATVTVHIASGAYAGTYTARFTIQKKTLEILADPPTKVYDGTTSVALTPQYDPTQLVEGDVFDVTLRGQFQTPDVGTDILLSVYVEESGEDMAYYELILPDRLFGSITQATLPAANDTPRQIIFSEQGFTQPGFQGADGTVLKGTYAYSFGTWGPYSHEEMAERLSLCLSDEETSDPMILAMRAALLSDGKLTVGCSFTERNGNYKELSAEITFTPSQENSADGTASSKEDADSGNKNGGNGAGGTANGSGGKQTVGSAGNTVIKLILIGSLGVIALVPTGLVTFVIIFFAVRGHKNKKAKKQAQQQEDTKSS